MCKQVLENNRGFIPTSFNPVPSYLFLHQKLSDILN